MNLAIKKLSSHRIARNSLSGYPDVILTSLFTYSFVFIRLQSNTVSILVASALFGVSSFTPTCLVQVKAIFFETLRVHADRPCGRLPKGSADKYTPQIPSGDFDRNSRDVYANFG